MTRIAIQVNKLVVPINRLSNNASILVRASKNRISDITVSDIYDSLVII